MEKAIKRAIEGGWKFQGNNIFRFTFDSKDKSYVTLDFGVEETEWCRITSIYEILCDPLFWQALGRAEGWEKGIGTYPYKNTAWIVFWHRLIDALAEGKTADEFFNSILK